MEREREREGGFNHGIFIGIRGLIIFVSGERRREESIKDSK